MDLPSLLPIVAAILVGLVILRVLIAAVRMSARLMVWGVLAAAIFGLGYLWYQHQGQPGARQLPVLSIPAEQPPPLLPK